MALNSISKSKTPPQNKNIKNKYFKMKKMEKHRGITFHIVSLYFPGLNIIGKKNLVLVTLP